MAENYYVPVDGMQGMNVGYEQKLNLQTSEMIETYQPNDVITNDPIPGLAVDELQENSQQFQQIQILRNPNPQGSSGIGIQFSKLQSGPFYVTGVVPGSNAEKCGMIQPGHLIHEINGQNVYSLWANDLTSMIIGQPGTPVILSISTLPQDQSVPFQAVPAPVMQQQPVPVMQQQPAPVMQQQPAPVMQQQPTPVMQQQPAPVMQQQPAPVMQQQPAPVMQQQPAPVMQQTGSKEIPRKEVMIQRNALPPSAAANSRSGIGLMFWKSVHPGPYTISGVTPDGTAASSGLVKAGDLLHAVDAQDVYPLAPEQVTALILGTPGTMVKLVISSPSELVAPELPPNQGLEQFVLMRDESGKGPASRVNLQVGDYIHAINQFSLYDKDVNEVNALLNGMPHSVVSVWKQTFKASMQASEQLPAEYEARSTSAGLLLTVGYAG
ncbi:hypothetical protein GUITHDRAFT_146576 [Guillardia theta CCMP2712]|uniref:PDZ domain-containing protein n=1 Tax=Guillardia theta (strain CCMP2712) TaxID=905079 RepID=L1IH83_GUITC|nr:hypothetical protein GUITHDRAFT_146576 [Guillardia theta CCMP2712]EKX35264.1 hypothetical protein GUITHDRAFT_146576 [Guillardia theta CCMP2712]|eukprot:XP_005822244.1 hypothetical protein GUITHDRAFT_146576 [Guillardia theta CCMP2712]